MWLTPAVLLRQLLQMVQRALLHVEPAAQIVPGLRAEQDAAATGMSMVLLVGVKNV